MVEQIINRRRNYMKIIKGDYLSTDIDLDDVILFDEDDDNEKKTKKKKKKNKKKSKSGSFSTNKNKKKKKSKKKKKNKKSYKYKYKNKKGLLSDSVKLDVKSNVNIDITDDSVKNLVQSGVDLVRCFIGKKGN